MLSCNPKDRPSAKEILEKPFLEDAVNRNSRTPEALLQRFVKSIITFDKAYKKHYNDIGDLVSEWGRITDSMESAHYSATAGSLSGSVIGAAGGITALVGLILAPFTLGASLIVTGVGVGVGVAGGVTVMDSVDIHQMRQGKVDDPEKVKSSVLKSIAEMRRTHKNIALNARVVQSSLYSNGVAEHAVDGNRDTDYGKGSCTHTNAEFNPWWRADLGNVYSISRVAITNRGDCCKENLRGAQIRIGNNLENDGNDNELVATVLTVHDGTKTFEFEPVNGRYVNIFLPGNNEVLTLCEVEVFAEKDIPLYTCGPRNLALRGKAVQSSTYSELGVAENAIDGKKLLDFQQGSCSVTKGDWNPWWRVDLLDVYRVTRVSITNRGDCCEKRIEGIQIRIGNSLENNGNNNELAAAVGPIPLGDTKTFEFKPIKGRYVNLFLPGRSEYLTLCEVEVYAV
ncbi:hypothetical protein QQF64_031071 [Cirrhinus molitorella]|uniref:Fucolectin tachylectin-4 pentraxin-1 domain-containing protein n=1 Tax=Cirrhinus molitorella TaxID=172907 RepID=A0ABR3N547_9TELE